MRSIGRRFARVRADRAAAAAELRPPRPAGSAPVSAAARGAARQEAAASTGNAFIDLFPAEAISRGEWPCDSGTCRSGRYFRTLRIDVVIGGFGIVFRSAARHDCRTGNSHWAHRFPAMLLYDVAPIWDSLRCRMNFLDARSGSTQSGSRRRRCAHAGAHNAMPQPNLCPSFQDGRAAPQQRCVRGINVNCLMLTVIASLRPLPRLSPPCYADYRCFAGRWSARAAALGALGDGQIEC